MFIARSLRGVVQGVLKVSPKRSLSATTAFSARPHPRPAPKKLGTAPLQKAPIEEQLPPLALLKSAKKSGALDIEPDAALSVLRNYVELSAPRQTGKWEKQFCAEEKITPRTLVLLGLILTKCKEKPRMILAAQLLFSASAIGESTATLYILSRALKRNNLNHPQFIAPLARLRTLADPPYSNIEAMVLLGKIYESQNQEDKAFQLYQQAAATSSSTEGKIDPQLPLPVEGVASALIHQGLMLQQRGNTSAAEAAFRKAALEHDDPSGYYHLALLQRLNSLTQETYLLKAVSSGITRAATGLGQIHLGRARTEPAEKATHIKLAKEWLYLGATAGEDQSMLLLAEVFIKEGKMQSAQKWLEMAEKSQDPLVTETVRHLTGQVERVTSSVKEIERAI